MKRSLILVTCVIMFALALGLEAGEMEEPEVVQVPLAWHQAALTDGEALYTELCAVCHGAEGLGDGPAAKALAKPVPDLTAMRRNADGVFPRQGVEKAIRGQSSVAAHGTIDMPIWGNVFSDARPDLKSGGRWALAEQRIHNLTAYIETIQE